MPDADEGDLPYGVLQESPRKDGDGHPHATRLNDPQQQGAVKLEANIGLFSGINIIVGSIVGAGIFLSPTFVLKSTGSVGMALIVWTLSGAFALLGALCYTELGLTVQESGAEYTYVMAAFGELPAFIIMWANLVGVIPSSMAIVALTCANYMIHPFLGPDCPTSEAFLKIVAILCMGEYIQVCLLVCLSVCLSVEVGQFVCYYLLTLIDKV